MMLMPRHLKPRDVAGDDAIIIVARALKSDFLARKLAALSVYIFLIVQWLVSRSIGSATRVRSDAISEILRKIKKRDLKEHANRIIPSSDM